MIKLSDSHSDFLTCIDSKRERETYIKNCAKNNVKIISSAVFTTHSQFTIDDIVCYKEELDYLTKKYNISLILSIEDLGFINTQEELLRLINLHPFSVTLTWNQANQYGGGALTDTGLTPLGIETIRLLEENKILIDTAHMSRASFDEFCHTTTLPIYNSHSNIYSLHTHARNLTDNQIQKIIDSNGFLGITLYEKFISNNHITSTDIAYQFDYLIKNFGDKNIGFGTDLYGIPNEELPTDISSYLDLNKISIKLKFLGYSDDTINRIFHRNYEDFINRIHHQ